ncbi:MAG: hypothetical protein GF317_01075 [Candidatus Lokiarchaeota archaeon]|nr:hypothetical protein [Candidatus Lokiarchaeota archaeon]MBD3198551.1 hypothetical protein [Candidatus Lokiarchaeota archaeon]
MTIENGFIINHDITKNGTQLHIHYFFVFNNAGICLYGRNFTNKYHLEANLISAFSSALISFSEEMIGKKVKVVDMGNVKIAIYNRDFFYYGFLCDSIQNLITLENLVSKINYFLVKYVEKHQININVEYIHNDDFNSYIDDIVRNRWNERYKNIDEQEMINKINQFSKQNDIKGIILFSDKGRILYSSLNKQDLNRYLNQLDFRIKICNNSVLKLYYTSDSELIFTEYINDLYYIVLVFDLNTAFGIGECYLKKCVELVKESLN